MKKQLLAASLIALSLTAEANLLFDKQWAIKNNGQSFFRKDSDLTRKEIVGLSGTDINWTNIDNAGDKEIIVAVIDSGVDINHPDLKGRIWYNNKLCQNATNSKFLDCYGKNFLDNSNDLTDELGHGTHVAGIIAAENNSIGIQGITPKNIKIMPLKVINDKVNGFTYKNRLITSVVAQAMMYAVKNGASVINLSLGWPKLIDTKEVRDAFEYANKNNVTVVAAAGNNNKDLPTFPCSYESVICVGAIDNQGALSEFSNHGKNVDILAPGENIISTIPYALESRVLRFQGYEYKNGSSQAAPMVSAVAATLKLVRDDLGDDEIKNLIYSTAKNLFQNDPKKFSKFGLLDMKAAIIKSLETEDLDSLIIPELKEVNEIAFKASMPSFKITFPIKNLSQKTKDEVRVCLYPQDFSVRITESCQVIPSINSVEVVSFEGMLTDLNIDSHVLFDVVIDGKTYKSSLVFSRDLTDDQNVVTYSLGQQNFDQMGIINDQRKLSRLNKVMDRHSQANAPEYFFNAAKIQTKEETIVSLIQYSNEENHYSVKSIKLPKLNRVLSLHRADINQDGDLDYLVYALNEKRDSLEFFVLNSKLEELYAGFSNWSMKLSTFEGLPIESGKEDFQWIQINHETFGKMIVPSIYKTHAMPEEDNSKILLERLNSLAPHQYYLLPEIKDNKIELKQRVLDSVTVMRKIRTQLGVLGPYDSKSVYLQKPLSQTLEDISSGVVRAIVMLEDNGMLESFELRLAHPSIHSEVSLTKISTEQELSQSLIYDVTNAQTGKINNESVFTFLLDRSNAQVLNYENYQIANDFNFRTSWDNPILALTGIYSDRGNKKYLFENRYTIALINENGEKSELPIYRDSSFPGQTFAETLTPVLSQGRIGLFVNSTMIFGNRIYSMIDSHFQGLIRPMSLSVSIPANCVALNPETMADKSMHNYLFLCKESSNEVQLKLLPLSAY